MRLDDYVVPSKNLKVRANMPIASEALGGQTSATDEAHKGFKAKILTVSLVIAFTDEDQLTQLIQTAEKVDENNDKKIYKILDRTANAMKVRQVTFSEGVNVREAEKTQAWEINFVLKEYLSIPEKAEQKLSTKQTQGQQSEGVQIQSEVEKAQELADKGLSSFERVLSVVDKFIGPSEEQET